MNERDFIYWLQGFLELSGAKTLNEQQVKIVKDHIALVMTKVTPNTIVGTENITIPQFSPIVTCTTSTELPNLGDTSVSPLTVPPIKSDLYCANLSRTTKTPKNKKSLDPENLELPINSAQGVSLGDTKSSSNNIFDQMEELGLKTSINLGRKPGE
jgi:hypothetical protein